MLVLITYDVNTETAAGRKRLRKVAKSAWTTGSGCRILSSSACWTPRSLLF